MNDSPYLSRMKKREFIKVSAIAAAGAAVLPLHSCTSGAPKEEATTSPATTSGDGFKQVELPYKFDALAPNIDARTMEIHYGKHHGGYTRKFNNALKDQAAYAGKSAGEIMGMIKKSDTALRNNGGGFVNHNFFWESMTPKSMQPAGDLLSAINGAFGSLDNFKTTFANAAKTRFGSGWAWLGLNNDGKLAISSTANQDNPWMTHIVADAMEPLLGLDVWEHAYYLQYQNRRGDYINNFFNIVNWDKVAERLAKVEK